MVPLYDVRPENEQLYSYSSHARTRESGGGVQRAYKQWSAAVLCYGGPVLQRGCVIIRYRLARHGLSHVVGGGRPAKADQ